MATDDDLNAALHWLAQTRDTPLRRRPTGGGSICKAWIVTDGSGKDWFIKTHAGPPKDLFQAESEGLRALCATDTVRTPTVQQVDERFLILEHIATASPRADAWERLGRQLAALHAARAPCFGFTRDNYCGSTPQPNPCTDDGYQFFSDNRLLFQARRARDMDRLSAADVQQVESLCRRLSVLVPDQKPSLLHGDLWSGNLLFDAFGQPVLIDPAAYWGWAECDIGMTELFGGFNQRVYSAWEETFQPVPGWRERLPIYNLYHLLNHLNLFGATYLGSVQRILKHYR